MNNHIGSVSKMYAQSETFLNYATQAECVPDRQVLRGNKKCPSAG